MDLRERELNLREKELAQKDASGSKKPSINTNQNNKLHEIVKAQVNTAFPFIGTRHFSFYGGPGTGESITITKDGKVIIKEEPGRGEPSIVKYKGQYKDINNGYKIVGKYIYWVGQTDCGPEGGPCKATLSE